MKKLISKSTKLTKVITVEDRGELYDIIQERLIKSSDLDLSDINVSKITSFDDLFFDCGATTINVSGWNISNATDLSEMFANCKSLQEIIGLETWNMSNAENIMGMFYYCKDLCKMNISTWNTENCKDMSFLFADCSDLETLGGKEITLNCKSSSDVTKMFLNCYSLKGIIHLENVSKHANGVNLLDEQSKNMTGLLDVQIV